MDMCRNQPVVQRKYLHWFLHPLLPLTTTNTFLWLPESRLDWKMTLRLKMVGQPGVGPGPLGLREAVTSGSRLGAGGRGSRSRPPKEHTAHRLQHLSPTADAWEEQGCRCLLLSSLLSLSSAVFSMLGLLWVTSCCLRWWCRRW